MFRFDLSCYILVISLLLNKVATVASDKVTPPSCLPIPKTNLEKQKWLTTDLRSNLCQLWECSMDLLEVGDVLVFDGERHSIKALQEVPLFAESDPQNSITETLVLRECANAVLGHRKLDCNIEFKKYLEVTACSLGLNHKKGKDLSKDVPQDPKDPFNTVTETIILRHCVNRILGHSKLNCKMDFDKYLELTACSLDLDYTKEKNIEHVKSLFDIALNTS